MADKDDILQILIRFRADVDDALAKMDKVPKNLRTTQREAKAAAGGVEALGAGLRRLAAPVLALFTIEGLRRLSVLSFREFVAGEANAARLASQLRRLGVDAAAISPAIQGLKAEVSAFGIVGSEVDKALSGLLLRNFSLRQSFEVVRAATKLTVVEGGSLEDRIHDIVAATVGQIRAGTTLGQVLAGVRRELKDISDPAKRLEVILTALAGASDLAGGQLDTAEARIRRLGAATKELLEQIGTRLEQIGVSDLLGNLADALKRINEQSALGSKIARGVATPIEALQPEIEQTERRVRVLLKAVERIDANRLGRKHVAKAGLLFDIADIRQLMDASGLTEAAVIEAITGRNKEAAARLFRQMEQQADKLVELRQKEAAMVAAAERQAAAELDRQDEIKREGDRAVRIKESNDFLRELAQKELGLRADLAAAVDAQDAALRRRRFESDLAALGNNFTARLELVNRYYAEEARLSAEAARREIDNRQKAADKIADSLAELSGIAKTRLLEVAQQAAAGQSDVSAFIGSLDLTPEDRAKFKESFDFIVGLFVKTRAAANALSQQQASAPTDLAGAIQQEIALAASALEDTIARVNRQVELGHKTHRQAALEIGQQRDALIATLDLQSKNVEAAILKAKAEGQSTAQLEQQLALLQQRRLQSLSTASERLGQNPDDFAAGVEAGFDRVKAAAGGFGTVASNAIYDASQSFASFSAELATNPDLWKDAGRAAQQFFADLLRQIAQTIIQLLILRAITGVAGAARGGVVTQAGARRGGVARAGQVLTYSMGGVAPRTKKFGFGGVYWPEETMAMPRTPDDRFPVWVRGGEPIIAPEDADYYGGPERLFNAIKRRLLPKDTFMHFNFRQPMRRSYAFAQGGVTPREGLGMGERTTRAGREVPIVLNNVIDVTSSKRSELFSTSEFSSAISAWVAANPDKLERAIVSRGGMRR